MEHLKSELFALFAEQTIPLHFLQENAMDGMWYATLENGGLEMWTNEKYWETLGYTKSEAEFNNFTWSSLMFKEDLEHIQSKIDAHISNPIEIYDQVVRFRHKSGDTVWIRCQGQAFAHQGQALNRMFGTHRDITKEKTAEIRYGERIERYDNVIHGTDIGSWEWNIITGETIINEKWANIIGYTVAELEPTSMLTWNRFVHPEDKVISDGKLQEHIDGKSDLYECEFRMRHKDGHWVWILDRGRVASRTPEGNPEWITGSHIDITERKENELLLEKYQSLLESVNSVARIGWWEYDVLENKLYLSKVAKELHGIGLNDEMTPEEVVAGYVQEDMERVSLDYEKAIQSGKRFDGEYRIYNQDRKARWVRVLGIPEMKDGQCVRVNGLIQDIDNRVKSSKEIAIRNQELRATFRHSPNGMAIIGMEGTWFDVNWSICQILGYREEELLQKTLKDVTHPEDIGIEDEQMKNLLEGKIDSFSYKKRCIRNDGELIWTNASVSLVRSQSEEPMHFIYQFVDITEQVKREKEIEYLLDITKGQNERLLNFAHIVTHNLRSHSINLQGLTEMMREENEKITESENFSYMQSAVSNLNDTIEHLSKVIQMDTATQDSLEPCSLVEFINNALENVSALANENNVTIVKKVPDSTTILAVPAYLDSILINLVSNAIKYRSSQRPAHISISTKEVGNFIVMEVKDNGKGIDLERYGTDIFNIYKTFHDNEDARGIGLFITKNQIENMGGQIEVESEVGRGTSFICQFRKV